MASRCMYSLNNQYDNMQSAEMSNYNESLLMNIEDYSLNMTRSYLNSFVRSLDTSRTNPIDSTCSELKNYSVNSIHQLFNYIDFSHFLILCIKRENDVIGNILTSNYKSSIDYHKIKEIDFIKLMVVIRDRIDSIVERVHINDPCFSKELSVRLEELDENLKDCFFSQIKDIDVTEKFNLSSIMVDALLDDCNIDLLDLDKTILGIHQKWENKNKHCRLSKSRLCRLITTIIDSLQKEVMENLHTIGLILERLLNGYSNTYFKASHFNLTKEFMLEFHTEIDGRQYQNIVHLKHFHLELEQKTLALILDLKESQLMSNFSDQEASKFISKLSPIKSTLSYSTTPIARKKLSVLTSTPSLAYNSQHICPMRTDYDYDLTSECDDDPSVRSLDSGILPISENTESLKTSLEVLDFVPFSETVVDNEDCFVNKREIDEDSDCLGSMSLSSGYNMSAMCSTSNISQSEKGDDLASKMELDQSNNQPKDDTGFDGIQGFENYEAVINYLEIPIKQRDELRQKIKYMLWNDKSKSKFNCALSITIYRHQNSPLDELKLTLTYLEQLFFDFMRSDIREISVNHAWQSGLDIQNNNSACSPNFVSNFVSDFNIQSDQNTNNNADSKEDDSSDPSTSLGDLVNNLSLYVVDTGHQLAFTNSVLDSPTSDVITDNDDPINSGTSRGSESSDSNWQQYDSLVAKRSRDIVNDEPRKECSLILEDIDLALKLSELHLRTEFKYEQHSDNIVTEDRNKVVKHYKETTMKVISRIQAATSNDGDSMKEDWLEYVNQVCDTVDEVGDELRTESLSAAIVDVSLDDCTGSSNTRSSDCSEQHLSKKTDDSHDNESLSFSQRISLTISLTDRLLRITGTHLDHIGSLVNNRDHRGLLARIVGNKIAAIYTFRQRLNMVAKIMFNLKYSIQCSYYSETNPHSISCINKLISDAEKLSKLSFKLEEWIQKLDLATDKTDDTSYINELPDNLLVKLDPINTGSIVSLSKERLFVTVSALEQYPCYDRLMNSSLAKIFRKFEPISAKKLQLDLKTPQSNSELETEIHKLRRITAICALNIVDLHVVIAKIDEDSERRLAELNELLLCWRMVDKEGHRLLRCNSLMQHVLVDTRRTYVELVSLTAVMISIQRTVALSSSEHILLTQHMDNVYSYKSRVIEWLDEVKLCSSVVHKKRITNRRFKFYEDIHNYLEENLKSVSELAKHIRLGCHKTVKSLTEILSYCANLSPVLITEIDSALCTNIIFDNRYLDMDNNCNGQINESILGAIVNLEAVENNVSQMQDLLDQSKELFLVVSGDQQSRKKQQFECTTNSSLEARSKFKELDEQEISIIEKATLDLTEKISTIATYAASNALLLFIDKSGIGKRSDVETDQQISNWTSLSQNDDYLDKAVERIVDDVTSLMTANLFDNVLSLDGAKIETMMMPYRLVFGDICRQLRDKALDFLVDSIILNKKNIDDRFILASGEDLAEYFSEELSHVIIDDTVNALTIEKHSATSHPSIDLCCTKLQKRFSQKLYDRTVDYIANFVGHENNSNEHFTEQLVDLPLPVSTYRLWTKSIQEVLHDPGEILTKITDMLQTDLLSLKTYRCDIRRCSNERICNYIPRKMFRSDLPNARITSEKISKLVAQFDGGSMETSPIVRPHMNDVIMNRMCSTSVEINSEGIIKELINDMITVIPLGYKAKENKENCEHELASQLVEITEQNAKVSIIPINCFETELHNADVLQLCHVKNDTHRKSLVEIIDGNSSTWRRSIHEQCMLSVGENVPTLLETVYQLLPSACTKVQLQSSGTVGIRSSKCSSNIISHYSSLVITDENDQSEFESFGDVSNESPSETRFTMTNNDTLSSAVSGQRIINSSETVERCHGHYMEWQRRCDTMEDVSENSDAGFEQQRKCDTMEDVCLNSDVVLEAQRECETTEDVCLNSDVVLERRRKYDTMEDVCLNSDVVLERQKECETMEDVCLNSDVVLERRRKCDTMEDVCNNSDAVLERLSMANTLVQCSSNSHNVMDMYNHRITHTDYEGTLSRLLLLVFVVILVSLIVYGFFTYICSQCFGNSRRILLPKIVSTGRPF